MKSAPQNILFKYMGMSAFTAFGFGSVKGKHTPWKVKKGSLSVNKLLKKLKCQTTNVQKNYVNTRRERIKYAFLTIVLQNSVTYVLNKMIKRSH